MAENFEPRIVAFLCNWCSYAGADVAGGSKLETPHTLTPVRVMCSSRVKPEMMIAALLRGADGVLVAGCHPGDCHYDKGNYYARRRFAVLQKILETLGLEHQRVRLSWVSASEGNRYAEVVREFCATIKELGPNPMKQRNNYAPGTGEK
ncbi:MAG: hydrogenase iron-sulfur subunit [Chitinispirillaceae bacterium]|nr:hydrogenase iron-sulfur subunit [Chitinispirillaceae bacterium]